MQKSREPPPSLVSRVTKKTKQNKTKQKTKQKKKTLIRPELKCKMYTDIKYVH